MKYQKILFTGDVFINNPLSDTIIGVELSELFNEHIIKVCNIEGPITTSNNPTHKTGTILKQHTDVGNIIKKSGFNLANLANNHIMDYGTKGLSDTLKSLNPVITFGAGLSHKEAYRLRILELEDLKVGFLSYGEAEFGALTYDNSAKSGFAWICHCSVGRIIQEAKKQVAFLFVLNHAGIEEVEYPLPEWVQIYREQIDCGADAVIGNHPHVPQGWEVYKNKPIFYSLGNFYFDSQSENELWNKGLVVSLSLPSLNFEVIPVVREESKVDVSKDISYISYVNSLPKFIDLHDLESKADLLSIVLWESRYKFYHKIAMGQNEFSGSFKNKLRLLYYTIKGSNDSIKPTFLTHNIRIESHRWLVERAMKMMMKTD